MNHLTAPRITFVLAGLAGCYGAAPGRPPTYPMPDTVAGATIEVASETNTTIEDVAHQSKTCPQGVTDGPDCTVTTYVEAEPVTRTTTTATYDGAPIDYAQFRVMTDLERQRKLDHLDELRQRCRRADMARWTGLGLVTAGIIGFTVGASRDSKIGVYGGELALAGGITSYALGYFSLGGKDCNRAKHLYEELDVSADVGMKTIYGEDYAIEMKKLADRFNQSSEAVSDAGDAGK